MLKIIVTRLILLMSSVLMMFSPSSAQNLLSGPEGVVYDTFYNQYLVANFNNLTIVAIDTNRVQSLWKSGVPSPSGMLLVGDTLVVAGRNQIVGYNIHTRVPVLIITPDSTSLLNSVVADTSGYVYVSDATPGHIYKVNLSERSCELLVDADTALNMPVGLYFEAENNRLLVTCRPQGFAAIRAVSLADGSVTDIETTHLTPFGYITEDNKGYYYVSSHTEHVVYKYDHTFSEPRRLFSTGHYTPVQLMYNSVLHEMAIPNYTGASVDYISMVDTDDDDVIDLNDNCVNEPNYSQADCDRDSVGDPCDNCPSVGNTGQEDADSDGFGDGCDQCPGFDDNVDADFDNVPDGCDQCPGFDDNADADSDGIADGCDICPGFDDSTDSDIDAVPDGCDNCPDIANPGQEDADSDNIGDVCDGCCTGASMGNVDCEGIVDIGDVTELIALLFIRVGDPFCCEDEADLDYNGDIDISDLTILTNRLFITVTDPPPCP